MIYKFLLELKEYRKDLMIVALLATIVFNNCYNISLFPDYFGDEGTYIGRAINFEKTLQVYQNPDYVDHCGKGIGKNSIQR